MLFMIIHGTGMIIKFLHPFCSKGFHHTQSQIFSCCKINRNLALIIYCSIFNSLGSFFVHCPKPNWCISQTIWSHNTINLCGISFIIITTMMSRKSFTFSFLEFYCSILTTHLIEKLFCSVICKCNVSFITKQRIGILNCKL